MPSLWGMAQCEMQSQHIAGKCSDRDGGREEEEEGCLDQDEWKMRQRESETPGDNLQKLQV